MHHHELWQEYNANGIPLMNGGRPGNHNPETLARPDMYGATLVWLFRQTKDGTELLFQKRSKFVDRNAGKWDVSAGGHINYGEEILDAAVRESYEEIGVSLDKTKLIHIISRNTDMRHFSHIYLYDYSGMPNEFHFDDKEVEEVKWVPLSEVRNFWKSQTKPSIADDGIQLETILRFLS